MARFRNIGFRTAACFVVALLALVSATQARGQAAAGFSEYFIPGNEGATTGTSTQLGLYYAFNELDTGGTPASSNMHSVITVTAWSPNTAVYYDHWEDGYDFDPNNPTTADETVTLATMGALKNFETTSFAIPVTATTPGTGCNVVGTCAYDGGDRIYVAGGAVTVTRASWIQERGVGNQAVAWEIYPVKPQLTTYVLPFGENLGVPAFQRVFALIQATANGTKFKVDVDGNGTFDLLNANRNATKSLADGDTDEITLNAGQSFLLDAISACPTSAACTTTPGTTNRLLTGAVIQGSATLQVKFVAGITTANYGTRGLSAFPRGYWTKSYYAPLDQRSTANGSGTDYFLHNPHATALTVTWESRTATGSFSIPADSTVSFNAQVPAGVPVDSGLYFSAPDVFWGVGLGDTTGAAYEWGYSLLPSTFLSSEHFLGWAPGSSTLAAGTYNYNGAFLVPAQDNTRVFVDFNDDGTVDQTFDLNRLQTQFIYDTTDGNLTGAHIWATGEFTLAYGENADTATTSDPALDLGYVAIPGTDFVSLVLDVAKTANPQVVSTAAGSTTEFTIVASTRGYSLNAATIVDTLPPNWRYVAGTTTITRPDLSTVTGASANPGESGSGTLADPYVLTWSAAQLDPSGMAPNQQVIVKFTAETMGVLAAGTLSRNRVLASGSRTVGDPAVTQTFAATDFAFVSSGALGITKTSNAVQPLYPGDTFGYTVKVSDPAGGPPQNRVSLFDPLPAGVTLSGSVTLNRSTVADVFGAQAYNLNAGTRTWTSSWTELRDDASAAAGNIQVTGGELRLTEGALVPIVAQDNFDTNGSYAGFNGTNNWTGSWTETNDDLNNAATGAILVAGNQLRVNDRFNVVDNFATDGSYAGSNGTRTWAAAWTELNDDNNAGSGAVLVAGNQLRLSGRFAADYFGTNGSFATSNGNIVWTGNWVESDYGTAQAANDGGVRVAGTQLRLNNDNGVTTQSVTRGINLTGTNATSATLAFSCGALGAEAGDTAVVQYRLNGTGAFTTLETYADGVCGSPRSIPIGPFPSNTTQLEIRFAILSAAAYTDTYANERFFVDNLSLAINQEPTVTRGVDLSSFTGLTQANLTFTCATVNAGTGDTAQVRYRLGGSGAFTTLATYSNGTCTSPQNLTIPVTPALLEVQFAIPNSPGYTQDADALNEYFAADDVTISWAPLASVQRGVDLADSGATSATLAFNCGVVGGDGAADSFVAQYRLGGSGSWSTLATYTNLTGTVNCGANPQSLAIPSFSPGLLEVRFTVPNATSYVDAGEYFWIDNATVTANGGRVAISRGIDLTGSGATQATLSFDYRTSGTLGAADDIAVQYRTGGSGAWTTLATYTDDVTGNAALPLTLASPANLTEVRFTFPQVTDYTTAGQYFYVDNLSITYDRSVTAANPPGILGSGSLYTLLGGQDLVATFNVTVDDPFPTGSNLITNTAATTTAQFPIQITATVTDQVTVPTLLSATVAGRVWLDANGDGVQDIGEPGLSNVSVTLKDQFGTPVATLSTDVHGRYLFTGIAPGNGYYVEVQSGLPAGVQQSYPAGRSDNRTAAFNLAAGQNLTGVDLGYEPLPATASFGDLVWVDADSDGIRDLGEIGLGNVTLQLYRDSNGDGLFQPTDALVSTTTSSSDGSYLFSGVTPASPFTYFVVASNAPAGFTPTGSTTSRFQSVSGGNAYLTGDFGFVGTTYSISDRVFFDADQSGTYNGGDTGISGVTVEILDASLQVIGVTTTAADGTFTFSGLPGSGADYTTRISDTGGALTNFTGTTPFALARQRSEPNLTANRDRNAGIPGLAPSYGFFASRSIGDTVFYDVDGDGTQDVGEAGIAGIVVGLYTDTNNDGLLAGETLLGTVTTDAAGHYLFSGLTDGNYIVSVPPLTDYNYTGTGGAADSDTTPNNGTQRRAAMTGGANVLGIDFGYQAQTPASVSGTIWNDANRDGAIGAAETRLAGVTVDILSGTTVVATVTTDATGTYTFTGLAAGAYTIRVTDTAGALTGYSATYEATEGLTPPFNYQEAVTLAAGSNTGPRFGYALPTPTYVSVAWMKATTAGGVVTVEWETTQEVGTVGFDLHRLDPKSGAWVKVNAELLPALYGHPEGATYAVRDKGAPVSGSLTYKLVEVDLRDDRLEYGPWTFADLPAGTPLTEDFRQTPRPIASETLERLRTTRREKDAATAAGSPGQAVRLRTKGTGLRYVDAGSLAGPLGSTATEVSKLIALGEVALTNGGAPVPYIAAPAGAGLYFHAVAVESPYTDENAYFVSLAPGTPMRSSAAGRLASSRPASFTETVHAELDRYPLSAYFQDPEADFWAWDNLVAGSATSGTKTFLTNLAGVSAGGAATLTVRLHGGSNTAAPMDHHVRLSFNGRVVGETTWDGTVPQVVTIPLLPGDVIEGSNALVLTALKDPGVSFGVVYLDSFDVTYQRAFRASGDQLPFPLPAVAEATVAGFSSSSILVLDVTSPSEPVIVSGSQLSQARDGTWNVRVVNASPGARSYLAVDPARASAPVSLAPVRSPSLASPSNAADVVFIAPASLAAAATTLAQYRQTQQLSTMVVDVDDVYNEFGRGLATPVAIRDFLARATASWNGAPRYVTLLGRGTYDYRNVQAVGDNLVPPLLVATPFGLAASDVAFAPLDTAGPRSIHAIGRVPVLTSQELLDYVDKVRAHEAAPAGAWQTKLLLVADNADAGGSFPTDSDAVGTLAPAGFTTTKVYLPAYTASGARAAIVSAINSGTLVFNYLGHGGPDRLASENIFGNTDVASLTNAGKLPVFLAMTCSAGNFAVPGFPSLGEKLVTSKTGGAYVSWAPSGLSLNEGARSLNTEFFLGAFGDGEKVIGDNCTNALGTLDPAGTTGYMRSIYNILGEPLVRLP